MLCSSSFNCSMSTKIPPIEAFTLGADAAYLSSRPLPTAPDGHYDWESSPDANTRPEGHSSVTNLINQIETIKKKGIDVPNLKLVVSRHSATKHSLTWLQQSAFVDEALHPDAVDDRKGAVCSVRRLLESHFVG